jgi:hypothetical protein
MATPDAVLKRLAAERATPVLLVVATEGAEAFAAKNGLTIADLIRPFVEVKGLSIPFRTAAGGVFTVREFSLRTISAAEFGCPTPDAIEAALARAVSAAAPTGAPSAAPDAPLSTAEDAARWVSRARSADALAPWATA